MGFGSKTTKYKNITRMDYARNRAYWVRIRWKGKRYSRMFSDSKYHGRLGALCAALAWRDQIRTELGIPKTERFVIGAMRPSNTGIRGVRKRLDSDGYVVYEATWMTTTGKMQRRRFSVNKYGEQGARDLAKKARQQGFRQMLRTPTWRE